MALSENVPAVWGNAVKRAQFSLLVKFQVVPLIAACLGWRAAVVKRPVQPIDSKIAPTASGPPRTTPDTLDFVTYTCFINPTARRGNGCQPLLEVPAGIFLAPSRAFLLAPSICTVCLNNRVMPRQVRPLLAGLGGLFHGGTLPNVVDCLLVASCLVVLAYIFIRLPKFLRH